LTTVETDVWKWNAQDSSHHRTNGDHALIISTGATFCS